MAGKPFAPIYELAYRELETVAGKSHRQIPHPRHRRRRAHGYRRRQRARARLPLHRLRHARRSVVDEWRNRCGEGRCGAGARRRARDVMQWRRSPRTSRTPMSSNASPIWRSKSRARFMSSLPSLSPLRRRATPRPNSAVGLPGSTASAASNDVRASAHSPPRNCNTPRQSCASTFSRLGGDGRFRVVRARGPGSRSAAQIEPAARRRGRRPDRRRLRTAASIIRAARRQSSWSRCFARPRCA